LCGTVSLEVEEPDGEAVEVAAAGPGDLLGWSPVLGSRAMTATAYVTARCRLAVLYVPQLLALCEREPQFASAFYRQSALALSDRLGNTRRHLAAARTVSQRLPFAATVEGNDGPASFRTPGVGGRHSGDAPHQQVYSGVTRDLPGRSADERRHANPV